MKDQTRWTKGPWKCAPFYTPEREDDPLGVYKLDVGVSLQSRYEDCSSLEAGSEQEQIALDAIHAENLANAQLIAKAPEMADMLQRVLARVELIENMGQVDLDIDDQATFADAKHLLAQINGGGL